MSMREILLTGSAPLQPAAKVFEALARHLGTAAPFYPDGEQAGWLMATMGTLAENPSLEKAQELPLTPDGSITSPFYRLKFGLKSKDLKLGPFRVAANAIESYKEFKRLKDAGTIPAATRFQVTIPGPGMVVAFIHMLPQETFPLAAQALWREIEQILEAIPAKDLVIQFDQPNETSAEEYERRPWAFNIAYYDIARLRLKDGVEALGWLANQVPADVPIGIHTCSAWHLDPTADQDNRAIVDIGNQYLRAVKRPLRYINIPIHPNQTRPSDFVPFNDLELKSDTVLSLGLINLADGLEGGKKRIAAAEKAGVFDFGVSFWCGLGQPGHSFARHPFVQMATADNLGEVLQLHKQIAAL